MKVKINFGNKFYRVEIIKLSEDLVRVRVENNEFFFKKNEIGEITRVEPPTEKNFSWGRGGYLNVSGKKEIKSLIAGNISSVEVKKGDLLKPGQKVATLIAMKMENEIIAEVSGEIAEVKIKEGQFVNTGDILIILK